MRELTSEIWISVGSVVFEAGVAGDRRSEAGGMASSPSVRKDHRIGGDQPCARAQLSVFFLTSLGCSDSRGGRLCCRVNVVHRSRRCSDSRGGRLCCRVNVVHRSRRCSDSRGGRLQSAQAGSEMTPGPVRQALKIAMSSWSTSSSLSSLASWHAVLACGTPGPVRQAWRRPKSV